MEKKAERHLYTTTENYGLPHVEHGVQVGASPIKKYRVELEKIQETEARVTRER